jgi:hypothetical protein
VPGRAPAGAAQARRLSNAPAAVASIPFMITHAMKARLRERGCTAEQIASMTPAEAHTRLAEPWRDDPAEQHNWSGHDE